MSIADEARAEAERLYPRDDPQLSHVGKKANADRREGYERGYSDGASRMPEAAPSDTDREAAQIIDAELSRLAHGELSLEGTAGERVAQRLAAAGFFRTSQPVQVEVTAHKITQRMPWPPSPESSYMLSLFECSCGWKTNTFKDTRDNRATMEGYRQFAEAHVAALGGGDQ